MIELHCHTFFSDGELLPSELVRRARVIGYRGVAMTDHADASNVVRLVEDLAKACADLNQYGEIVVAPGVELTHVPPPSIARWTEAARAAGAKVVVVHGETIVEPVPPGTNRAAIEARVDVLAHPGFLTGEEARLAAEYGVALEITTRSGHGYTNAHVANLARRYGAKMVLDNDAHAPRDLLSPSMQANVARGAGLSEEEVRQARRNAWQILTGEALPEVWFTAETLSTLAQRGE